MTPFCNNEVRYDSLSRHLQLIKLFMFILYTPPSSGFLTKTMSATFYSFIDNEVPQGGFNFGTGDARNASNGESLGLPEDRIETILSKVTNKQQRKFGLYYRSLKLKTQFLFYKLFILKQRPIMTYISNLQSWAQHRKQFYSC